MAKKKAPPPVEPKTYPVIDPCLIPKMPGTPRNSPPFQLRPSACGAFGVARYIGSGSTARVYESAKDPDLVVKFTRDPGDAGVLSLIENANFESTKNLVRTYDVALMPDAPAKPTYAALVERLDPLPERYAVAARSVGSAVEDKADSIERRIMQDELVPRSAIRTLKKTARERCLYAAQNNPEKEKICAITAKMVDGYDQLLDLGVFTVDIHPENWGMRGDEPVLLDVGMSFFSGQPAFRVAGMPSSGTRWSPPWA